MIQVPILDYQDAVGYQPEIPTLLRLPYIDMDTIHLTVNDLLQDTRFYGILAPYSEESLEFNIRCAARIKDMFPTQTIFIAVPRFKTYERIKTIFRAGFSNIVVPQYLGGVEYDHYFQFIEAAMLDNMVLHIAGGKFSSETYNREGWTWSKETL